MQSARKRFFSTRAKYAGSEVEDLELHVKRYGDDVIHLELRNCLHGKMCRVQWKRLIVLTGLMTVYFATIQGLCTEPITIQQARVLFPAFIYIVLAIYIFHTALNIVRAEKLFYSWDLALQTETVRTFGRESVYCVHQGSIHDIVINEVIEDLDIRYVLVLRTRGGLFKNRPIIPLFHSLSPSFECLQQIRQLLHNCWLQSKTNRSKYDYNKENPSKAAS